MTFFYRKNFCTCIQERRDGKGAKLYYEQLQQPRYEEQWKQKMGQQRNYRKKTGNIRRGLTMLSG